MRQDVAPALDSWFDMLDDVPAVKARRDAGTTSRPAPLDQAAGLRRMFTTHTLRFVPVVANPHLAFGGALLERLVTCYAGMGLRTLIVDAGEHARTPGELVALDLAEGIERLDAQVAYLAARGLPLRYVDASGSTDGFLDVIAQAAPQTDVVLLHAGASDLVRMLVRRARERQADALRPIVLADARPESITHAYAAIKLFASRGQLMVHDLLIASAPSAPVTAQIAERLARCADDFLGAVQHDCVAVDPAEAATERPGTALLRLAREQLAAALPMGIGDSVFGALDMLPPESSVRRAHR